MDEFSIALVIPIISINLAIFLANLQVLLELFKLL